MLRRPDGSIETIDETYAQILASVPNCGYTRKMPPQGSFTNVERRHFNTISVLLHFLLENANCLLKI